MAKSLAELLEDMNAHLPTIQRHWNRGKMFRSRYDGHSCHLAVACDCRDLDGDAAPDRIHGALPNED
jgi:hypothetical protein